MTWHQTYYARNGRQRLQDYRFGDLQDRMRKARSVKAIQALVDEAHRLRAERLISARHIDLLGTFSLERLKAMAARRPAGAVS